MPPKKPWPARFNSFKAIRIYTGALPVIQLHSVCTWEAGDDIGRSILTNITREQLEAMIELLDKEET